jgi:hypothetical protein
MASVRKIAISGYCFSVEKNQSIMMCSVRQVSGALVVGCRH